MSYFLVDFYVEGPEAYKQPQLQVFTSCFYVWGNMGEPWGPNGDPWGPMGTPWGPHGDPWGPSAMANI